MSFYRIFFLFYILFCFEAINSMEGKILQLDVYFYIVGTSADVQIQYYFFLCWFLACLNFFEEIRRYFETLKIIKVFKNVFNKNIKFPFKIIEMYLFRNKKYLCGNNKKKIVQKLNHQSIFNSVLNEPNHVSVNRTRHMLHLRLTPIIDSAQI